MSSIFKYRFGNIVKGRGFYDGCFGIILDASTEDTFKYKKVGVLGSVKKEVDGFNIYYRVKFEAAGEKIYENIREDFIELVEPEFLK